MLYRNYKNRLERIAKIIDFIKKHKVLILSCIGTLFALLIAFVSVRGIITAPIKISASTIVYGQEVDCQAGALFRNVNFEHKLETSDTWVSGLPDKVGKYSVRGYSARAFGQRSYTEEIPFVIQPKTIELKFNKSNITYGEQPKVNGAINSGDKIDEQALVLVFEKTVGQVRFDFDVDSIKIVNEEGENVTDCYAITASGEIITVNRKTLNFNVSSAEKVYDGTPLTSDKYEISDLVFGDVFKANFSRSQTNVGSIKNSANFDILNQDGQDVSDCYKIIENVGTLKVNQRPITVGLVDKKVEYDADKHTCSEYKLIDGTFVEGHLIGLFDVDGYRIDVGVSQVEFSYLSIIDTKGVNVTDNYQVEFEKGKVEITPRQITLLADGSKVYDANVLALTSVGGGINVVSGSLILGHVLTVETLEDNAAAYGSDGVWYKILDGEIDVKSNYLVTFDSVNLVINRRPVTFTAASDNKIYDSQPLFVDSYQISNLLDGHIENVTVSGSITDVGEQDNVITFNSITCNSEDVSKNYEVELIDGKLTVTKRSVSIKADANKVYDDLYLIDKGCLDVSVLKVENDGTQTQGLYGEQDLTADFESVGEYTDKGFYANSVRVVDSSLKVINGSLDNYDVSCINGNLTITPRPITVTTGTGTKVYNALSQTYKELTVDNLVEWHFIEFEDWCELVDVDLPTDNIVRVDMIFDCHDRSDIKTDNYEISYVYGKFNIEPRVLKGGFETQTTYDDKVFSATFTDAEVQGEVAQDNRLVGGHYISTKTNGVDAGEYSLSSGGVNYEVSRNDGLSVIDVTKNYDLSEFNLVMQIDKRNITVYAQNYSKIYDGNAFSTYIDSLSADNIVSGHIASGFVVGTSKNAINKEQNFTYVDLDKLTIKRSSDSSSVLKNYSVETECGTLEITKCRVTFRLDVEKVYDDVDLFVQGDSTIEYIVTASLMSASGLVDLEYLHNKVNLYSGEYIQLQTADKSGNVCIDADVYTDVINCSLIVAGANGIADANGFNYQDNYDIVVEKGDAIIKARELYIEKASASKKYDRLPLTKSDIKVENKGDGLVSTHTLKIDQNNIPSLTKVGQIDNDVPFSIINSENVDKTYNYNIHEKIGKLSVTKRDISIAIYSQITTYDGKYHSFDNMEYGLYNSVMLDGDTLLGLKDYVATDTALGTIYSAADGGIRKAGYYKITATPEISINDSNYTDFNDYYNITFVFGQFDISKRELYVTTTNITSSNPITAEHTKNAYNELGAIGEGDTVEIVMTGEQLSVGSSVNKVGCVIINGKFFYINGNGEYDADDYKIIVKQGTLTYQ